MVARNEAPAVYGKLFDSISICLSKSLGAPVGSILLGKKEFIHKARRIRKLLGGGMRQAGYLAAAGLYALQHHVSRLSEDHRHAQQIAKTLQEQHFVKSIMPAETNIIIFEVSPPYTAMQVTEKLKEKGVLVYAISLTRIRMVLHLGVTPAMVDASCAIVAGLQLDEKERGT
jgi:threonine aldolase